MAAKRCLICSGHFKGRTDAKTCSPRCRKRLQQVRFSLAHSESRRRGRANKIIALILLGLFGLFSVIINATPQKADALTPANNLNFQARLLNTAGAVVPDGNYNIDFKIYNADSVTGTVGTCNVGSNCLWEETYLVASSQGVAVTNGYFSVNLNSLNNNWSNAINWDQQYYLTMNVTTNGTTSCTPRTSCTWNGEMQNATHSIALTSVPLAFRANQLAVAGTNEQILQFASSTFGQATTINLQDPVGATANICYETSGGATAHTCAAATGGSGYIQNSTGGPQSANFNIISAAAGSIGGIIHANAGQSVDIFDVNDSGSNVYLGVSSNGSLTSSPATAGTITLGTATQTGTITIGQATTATTQAVNIESANGTASTQTVTIGGGTSTTSGGKVVNLATGAAGTGTTNTVHIADTVPTGTGTNAVTVGTNTNASTVSILGGTGTGTGSAGIKLQPATGGDVFIGNTGGTGTIIIGSSTGANPVQIANGSGASAVSIANVQNGGSVSVGAGFTTGTFAVGGTATTGTITIGQTTTGTTATVNILSANGTASTQTITIGGGTSTTSGGKVVNIATGAAGTGTTNTVHIADTSPTGTGTNAVTIGSNSAANNVTIIQGGVNGANETLQLQVAAAGVLGIGTANTTKTIDVGSVGSTAAASTIKIANTTDGTNTQSVSIGSNANVNNVVNLDAGNTGAINIGTTTTAHTINVGTGGTNTQAVNIGSINGSSSVTIQGGTTGTTISLQSGTGGTIAIGSANGNTVNIGGNAANTPINITSGGTGNVTVTSNSSSTGTIVKSGTNSSTAFQVQNAVGAALLLLDSTSTDNSGAQLNYLIYPGFETGAFNNAAAGWNKVASATLAQNTNKAHTFNGTASAQLTTTASGDGLTTSSFVSVPPANTYIVSFYAKLTAGSSMTGANFTVATTGGVASCNPQASITLATTTVGFQRLWCSLAPAAGVTALTITQNVAGGRTIYIDSVQMQPNDYDGGTNNITQPTAYQFGALQIRGAITNPLVIANNGDSVAALQVQATSGNQVLGVDTLNAQTVLGTSAKLGGALVFNTVGAGAITINTASTASNYTLTLPTTGPGTSQCLQTDSVTASQLKFAACASGSTLAATYNTGANHTDETITLTATGSKNGVVIQDASTPIATDLFTVQNNGGTTKYLNVDATKVSITDDLNVGTKYGNRLFSDNFESGGLSLWSNGAIGAAPPSISTTLAHDGKYSAKINATASNGSVSTPIAGSSTVYLRFSVNVTSQSTAGADLVSLRDSGGGFWQLYRDSATTSLALFNTHTATTDFAGGVGAGLFTLNAWHQIELEMNVGNTALTAAWFDGTQIWNSAKNNGTGVTINKVQLGIDATDSNTETAYIDDLSVDIVSNGVASSLNVDDSFHVGGTSSFGSQVLISGGNSTTAFQVQNAAGNSVLAVDTLNEKVTTGNLYVGQNPSGIFSDDFESNSFSAWSSTSTGAGSTATIDSTIKHNGNYSAKFVAANTNSYATKSISGTTTIYEKEYVYISSQGVAGMSVINVSASSPSFTLEAYRNVSSDICAYSSATGIEGCSSTGPFTLNAWHKVEVSATNGASTGTTKVWIDGTLAINVTNVNNGSGNFTSVVAGTSTASGETGTQYIDEFFANNLDTSNTASLTVSDALSVSGTTTLNGNALVKTTSDSGSSFQIQNASGAVLLNADTTNMRISVGSIGTATGQLYVSGSLPTAPIYTTTTNLSSIGDVFVQGRYAYVTSFSNTKLLIYDVSNPASAALVNGTGTTLSGVTNAGGINVQGHYAYILSYGSNELSVYDVSNPSSPSLVSTVSTVTQPFGLSVSGRYAYLTGYSSGKLQIFDISNPTNPTSISSTSTTNANPCAVRVQGNYAYVTVGGSGTAFMQIFNISNPASPTSVSNTSVGAGSACTSGNADNSAMFVQGRYAYYPYQSANQVKVYDVSNPASPSVAATISTGTGPNGVFVQGRYLYVTARDSNRVEVYDISNMSSVVSLGNIATGSTTSALFVQGRYLYVGVPGSSTFDIFDMGGEYAQQFEAGGAELGTLGVDGNSMFAGDVNIQGGTTIGQSLQVGGDIGVSGGISTVGDIEVGSTLGSRIFSDNFESGNFGLWPGVSTTGSPSVQTSTVHGGKYAASFSPSAAISDATVNFAGQTTVYAREWVDITSQTSTNLNVFSLSNGAAAWDVYRNNGGTVNAFNSNAGATTITGGSFTTGSWHLIELRITVGTTSTNGTTTLSLDGSIVGTSQNGNAHNGTTAITQFIAGQDNASNTGVMYVDEVSIDDSASTGSGSSLTVSDSLHVGGSTALSGPFVVQNANGSDILKIDGANTNLISNGDLESDMSGWSAKGTAAAPTLDSSRASSGIYSLRATTGAIGNGAQYTFPTSLPVGTYSVSFYVSLSNTSSAFAAAGLLFGLTNGAGDQNCTRTSPFDAPAISFSSMLRFKGSCTINTTAATAFYIKQAVDATSRTIWIDSVDIETGNNGAPLYGAGTINLDATVASNVNIAGNIVLAQQNGSPLATTTPTTGVGTVASGNYYYRMQAIYETGTAKAVNAATFPQNLSSTGEITLNWTASPGAIGYILWRTTTACGWASNYIGNGSTTSAVDNGTNFSWSGSVCGQSAGTGAGSGNVTLQSGSLLTFDGDVGNEYIYSNSQDPGALGTASDQLTIANWNNNGNIFLQSDSLTFQDTNNGVNEFQIATGTGSTTFQPQTDNATAFVVQAVSGPTPLFTVDTQNKRVIIGSGSTGNANGYILVLDNKTGSSADPTGVNGGMYYNVTTGTFRCFQGGAWRNCLGGGPSNQSTATQGALTAGTDTYLTNSSIPLPTGGFRGPTGSAQDGSKITWRIVLSKTAAGTTASTLTIRVGTNGTTADTARCTAFNGGTPTAAIDGATIYVTVYATAGGSGTTLNCSVTLTHQSPTAGFANTAIVTGYSTQASFDSTPANTKIGISYNAGTASVITVQSVDVVTSNL